MTTRRELLSRSAFGIGTFALALGEFARLYNIAMAVTGPVLAAAVNSPLMLGRRLWAETRIAVFQQSVDTRNPISEIRDVPARVS